MEAPTIEDQDQSNPSWKPDHHNVPAKKAKTTIKPSKPSVDAVAATIANRQAELCQSNDVNPVASPPISELKTEVDRRMLKLTKKEQCSGTLRAFVYDQKLDMRGTEKVQFEEYNPTSKETQILKYV